MLPSPCINVCKMDRRTGLCLGCFRTINEITIWARTDDSQRAQIIAAVARRRQETAAPESETRGA